MTDIDQAYVCLLRRGPRTKPPPPATSMRGLPPNASIGGQADWEARRHQNEVCYWAKHMDEFVSFLPGLRRHRGNERTAQLVADVLTDIKASQGQDAAVLARDRLIDRWRDRREGVRPGPSRPRGRT